MLISTWNNNVIITQKMGLNFLRNSSAVINRSIVAEQGVEATTFTAMRFLNSVGKFPTTEEMAQIPVYIYWLENHSGMFQPDEKHNIRIIAE